MKFLRGAAVVFVLSAATSIQAGESITGRWAADPSSCGGFGAMAAQSPLIVTDYAVRWENDSCRIERMYKTGDTVHLQALCWGNGGEHSVPISLRLHAGRLAVTWGRGSRGDLRRCQ
jgi:hypothetical protein